MRQIQCAATSGAFRGKLLNVPQLTIQIMGIKPENMHAKWKRKAAGFHYKE
jgi:hypothetical protein